MIMKKYFVLAFLSMIFASCSYRIVNDAANTHYYGQLQTTYLGTMSLYRFDTKLAEYKNDKGEVISSGSESVIHPNSDFTYVKLTELAKQKYKDENVVIDDLKFDYVGGKIYAVTFNVLKLK